MDPPHTAAVAAPCAGGCVGGSTSPFTPPSPLLPRPLAVLEFPILAVYPHWYQILLCYLLNVSRNPCQWPRHTTSKDCGPSLCPNHTHPTLSTSSPSWPSSTPLPHSAQTSFLLKVFRGSYFPPEKSRAPGLHGHQGCPELCP